jgi:4'-phosphopantetheinyl transferase
MTNNLAKTDLFDRLQTQVHAWFCFPESVQDETRLAEYRSVLSAQEVERYQRFNFDKDKHSYLVSHALLRHALSKYIDREESQWQFTSNEHGRPELLMQPGIPDIKFNLTHTDGLCACIITLGKACGIDAENIHRKNRLDAVARRMFADEELAQLDDGSLQQNFYYFWTLREAYVKALGTGLAGSSKEFYFDLNGDDLKAVLHHKKNQRSEADWQFGLYQPSNNHVLSVAVESPEPIQFQLAELVP